VKISSNAVMVDRQGSLWIAGNNGGLRRVPVHASIASAGTAVFDSQPDNFTTKEGLSGNRVYCLLEDREGGVWVGTDLGLDRFSEGVFRPVPVLNADRIAGLTKLRDGGLLIPITGEPYLHRVRPDGNIETLQLFLPAFGTCEDADGRIWVATSAGFGYWSGNRLSYPLQTGEGSIVRLVCGYGDVWMRDPRRGIIHFSRGKAAFARGLGPQANVIFPDGLGVVWAAYSSGMISVYGNGAIRKYVVSSFAFQESSSVFINCKFCSGVITSPFL
jgi:ligand-binding sensor domain-containing protein